MSNIPYKVALSLEIIERSSSNASVKDVRSLRRSLSMVQNHLYDVLEYLKYETIGVEELEGQAAKLWEREQEKNV